jgi:DNA recombination protein RmuC
MEILGGLIAGIFLGFGLAYLVFAYKNKTMQTFEEKIKLTVADLSTQALNQNADHFLKMAAENLKNQNEINDKELGHKKALIDQTLVSIKKEMEKVDTTVKSLEKDREQKFGELSTQLKFTAQETQQLRASTNQLNQALSNSKVRGQWGERMAEDILRLAGFIENVNYIKQKALNGTRAIPDFTFLLPNKLLVNMDVKFPLTSYLKYQNAPNGLEKESHKTQFLRDVKLRIKDVKDYISPENNTVDYVLLFIPNEQIYAFINEHGSQIIDEALRNKVIFCSPLTLYAVLAVIRQAVDNFFLEKKTSRILALLGSFKQQWRLFTDGFEKVEKKINEAQKEFLELRSRRKILLEKPLDQLNNLRQEKGIELLEEEVKTCQN